MTIFTFEEMMIAAVLRREENEYIEPGPPAKSQ
jgi:hypothetical protein